MPEVSGLLACACPVVHYIDHVIHWHVQFPFMLVFFSAHEVLSDIFSPPPLSLSFVVFVVAVFFFLHWCFPVRWVPVPFLSCVRVRVSCCVVVPVMGTLFQSRDWLPIVEAPGYSSHPTSTLAMQLLTR